jgi:hypothetical protein
LALEVHQQSPAVEEMAQQWPIVDALLGGTPAMRAAGETFLPRFPNEDADAYRARLNASTLSPAFRRTLSVMAGKPFARELTFGEDAPPQIVELCQDCDLQGNSLHVFASRLFREALAYGLCGVLVDYPTTSGARTLADERRIGARPYFVHVRHDQILGWRIDESGGRLRLAQLRIAESAQVPDGPFGTRTVKRVRVLEPGAWRLYQAVEDSKYLVVDEGTTTLGAIPFVPFFGAQTGPMEGVSPLLDLAYLNVKHWQSQSDQDNILHAARVPILVATGVEEDFSVVVGAATAVKIGNPAGGLQFVEHSGAAINAGLESLAALEQQMIQTGAELLVAKPGQRTATEAATDAEANKSDLQTMAEAFEDGLDQCLQLMADWLRLPEGGHVAMFRDYGAASLSEASGQLVVQMTGAGLIGKRTALRELQRRGALSPDLDPDAEIEAVESEGPSLGAL